MLPTPLNENYSAVLRACLHESRYVCKQIFFYLFLFAVVLSVVQLNPKNAAFSKICTLEDDLKNIQG